MPVDYTILKFLQNEAANAGRLAVLLPLCPLGKPSISWRTAKSREAYKRVRNAWIARVHALKDAGWEPLQKEAKLVAHISCPPLGVVTATSRPPCNAAGVCPFCYARETVMNPFCRLDEALRAHPSGNC